MSLVIQCFSGFRIQDSSSLIVEGMSKVQSIQMRASSQRRPCVRVNQKSVYNSSTVPFHAFSNADLDAICTASVDYIPNRTTLFMRSKLQMTTQMLLHGHLPSSCSVQHISVYPSCLHSSISHTIPPIAIIITSSLRILVLRRLICPVCRRRLLWSRNPISLAVTTILHLHWNRRSIPATSWWSVALAWATSGSHLLRSRLSTSSYAASEDGKQQ